MHCSFASASACHLVSCNNLGFCSQAIARREDAVCEHIQQKVFTTLSILADQLSGAADEQGLVDSRLLDRDVAWWLPGWLSIRIECKSSRDYGALGLAESTANHERAVLVVRDPHRCFRECLLATRLTSADGL